MSSSPGSARHLSARALLHASEAALWVSHFASDAALAVLLVRPWKELRAARAMNRRTGA